MPLSIPGLKLVHEFKKAHSDIIYDMAWSPDSEVLVTASADKTCKVYRVQNEDCKLAHTIKPQSGYLYSVAWSKDGSRLAIGSDAGEIAFAETTNFKILNSFDRFSKRGAGVTLAADGTSFVTGCQSGHVCWLSDRGAAPQEALKPHTSWVGSLSIAKDEAYLATCSQQDNVRVFEHTAAGWAEFRKFRIPKSKFYSVAWSPTEMLLATGDQDGTLKIWNPDYDEPVHEAEAHSNAILSIAFSSDGMLLATKSWDDTVKIWRRDTFSVVATIPEPTDDYPTSIAFAPSKNLLATLGGKDRHLRLWEYDKEELLSPKVGPQYLPRERIETAVMNKKCDVLVLQANPASTPELNLAAEVKRIEDELKSGPFGAPWYVEKTARTQAHKLSEHLLEFRPTIVHFAGHGSSTGAFLLHDEAEKAVAVSASTLSNVFCPLEGETQCVVFNFCYSDYQIEAILPFVQCVIAMSEKIEDGAAVAFAEGFYRGIGFRKSYYEAFRLGVAQIELRGFSEKVAQQVRFVSRDAADADPDLSRPRPVIAFRGGESSPAEPEAARPTNKPLSFPLWFGTNRKPDAGNAGGFSNDIDDRLHFGTCRVIVPKSHNLGELGAPWWRRILSRNDDRLKLLRDELKVFDGSEVFWGNVKEAFLEHEAGSKIAFIVVHGFHVTFEQAAIRAAQLGCDLQLPGITGFFSWPSQGRLDDYSTDTVMIEASEPLLEKFLVEFLEHSGAERVHLLAHSMGNRGVLRVLSRLFVRGNFKKRLGQLFLAAPDVASLSFRVIASEAAEIASQTTMYACRSDRALTASRFFYRVDRAGLTPPITVVPGVDTVDASLLKLDLLGHSYYGDLFPVINDIRQAVVDQTKPKDRYPLRQEVQNDHENYWSFPKIQ